MFLGSDCEKSGKKEHSIVNSHYVVSRWKYFLTKLYDVTRDNSVEVKP